MLLCYRFVCLCARYYYCLNALFDSSFCRVFVRSSPSLFECLVVGSMSLLSLLWRGCACVLHVCRCVCLCVRRLVFCLVDLFLTSCIRVFFRSFVC